MSLTEEKSYYLNFERFGRYNNISIPTESENEKDVFSAIEKNYKHYLLSSYIEISYDPETKEGDIFAGFQHVGKFTVLPQKIESQKVESEIDDKYRVFPSKDIDHNGFISPTGDYYYCDTYGHVELAEKLFKNKLTKSELRIGFHSNLEGWLHLSGLTIHYDFNYHLTQKQIDFLDQLFQKFQLKTIQLNGMNLTLAEIMSKNE